MIKSIAVLITCHNRCKKTLECLNALFQVKIPSGYNLETYLVDDGSNDGTSETIKEYFPNVKIIDGSGHLYWAGGMRLAWFHALEKEHIGYLLLNDDTILNPDSLNKLLETHNYSLQEFKKGGIYVGATIDPSTREFTYGGHQITNKLTGKSTFIKPDREKIKICDFANANILFVSKNVIEKIGILSDKYTHQLADFDYTLTAKKLNFPILICPNYCGICVNDHGNNWLSQNYTLKERIKYLKDPKCLAYNEYLYYIKKHYPIYLPVSIIKLWIKTLIPSIWDNFYKQ